ncbi:energy-coupling factor transport system substrate-specific component [Haladaptatus litoreus]|uniref:Energy-coupling factor transport system substrate-specific component n=1 Tax=Haladaptatus litoreus TaxID=553468 RepID=A0A1N7CLK7_9EURY|nr:ECF transporter S component [Haladaptatus litoreus]SIR64482.1 energy-coupling factor transport system substrate-specific component [Haladaptatus litoreus]
MSSTGATTSTSRIERFRENVSEDFTTTTWVLIPLGIGINAIGGFIASTLKLPLFLDNIGTMLIGILAGPWAAALTGGLANIVQAMLGNPVQLAFMPVPVAIGLVTGFLARRGWFDSVKKTIVPAVVLTVVATIIATPIVVLVFGGVTSSGTSLVTATLVATGRSLIESAATAQFAVEFVDKGGSAFVAYFIGKSVPTRYLPPQGQDIYS